MFKSLTQYKLDADWSQSSPQRLEAALQSAAFLACSPSQQESSGWVAPRAKLHAPMAEYVGGQLILRLRTEQRRVPGNAVRERLEQQVQKIVNETGRKPGAKRRKELKEEIVLDLLPRAFSKTSDAVVWIDPAKQRVVCGVSGTKVLDRVMTALVSVMAEAGVQFRPQLLQTALSPAAAMSTWLVEKNAPSAFSIDRECELKQSDADKAAVRYSRHALDLDEIAEHIAQGKLPTRLAMTWADRVSFVLTDAMVVRGIKYLDVVLEARKSTSSDDDGFDADAAIVTGELGALLSELLTALGGELQPGTPSERPAGLHSA